MLLNKSSKRNGLLVAFLWLLLPMVAFAHSPSQSSTILVEGKDGVWTLQIRASLTAFEQVVHAEYTAEGYKTPEEFQDLMGTLLSRNLHLNIDAKEINLVKPIIKLGHETIVVYKFVPPANFETVKLQNTLFKNINRSASSFMVLKNGSKRNLFSLDKKNQYAAQVHLENNEFVLQEKSIGLAGISINWYVLGLVLILGAFGMAKKFKSKKKYPFAKS